MTNKIFIGWDSREDVAYRVAKYSAERRTQNIEIAPLKQPALRESGMYWRDTDKLASTEFTFTRFLIPELMEYNGWALFMDCDMIFQENPDELFKLADDKYAVICAKHEYIPAEGTKMDGQIQTIYPRKNWSSVMLINCGHPSNRILTKELVNDPETTGAYLHRFSWLRDDEIGSLSHEWNWLVGWYTHPTDGNPKAIHYTEGGPYFSKYFSCEYHQEWKNEYHAMTGDYFTEDDVLDKYQYVVSK